MREINAPIGVVSISNVRRQAQAVKLARVSLELDCLASEIASSPLTEDDQLLFAAGWRHAQIAVEELNYVLAQVQRRTSLRLAA